ncbi:MAG: hypothetical protein CM15mP19_00030 [Gammaproteobacteria bacterium]|nr:MAG: hypothetical protein CM15mP19_00030 [Gammaproteobacteria bacterium]
MYLQSLTSFKNIKHVMPGTFLEISTEEIKEKNGGH